MQAQIQQLSQSNKDGKNNTQIIIATAIDCIVQKGGQKLYDRYIGAKLPGHAAEMNANMIQTQFETPYSNLGLSNQNRIQGIPSKEKDENTPKGLFRDSFIIGKIRKQKLANKNKDTVTAQQMTKSIVTVQNLSLSNCGDQTKNRLSSTIQNSAGVSKIKKFTPKIRQSPFRFLLSPNPEHPELTIHQQSLRQEKEQQSAKQQIQQKQQERAQKYKIAQTMEMKNKLEQLSILGLPCLYDDAGNVVILDAKLYKNKIKNKHSSVGNTNKILSLSHQTIDFHNLTPHHQHKLANSHYHEHLQKKNQHHCDAHGFTSCHHHNKANTCNKNVLYFHPPCRKRGFFSNQPVTPQKKPKLTNQQFNNSHARQYSTIPFLSISQGVKIVEWERNVFAEKNRKKIKIGDKIQANTLEDWKNCVAKSGMFKSFVKQYEYNGNEQTQMETQRPYTTARFNYTSGTKRTSETAAFNNTFNTISQTHREKHGKRMMDRQQMQNSILWRPRTVSNAKGRVSIRNQQLVKKVIQLQ